MTSLQSDTWVPLFEALSDQQKRREPVREPIDRVYM